MDFRKSYLILVLVTSLASFVDAGSKYGPSSYICRILSLKFIESQPILEYPIVYEPLKRGRLTIWSGVSSLPGSEFICETYENDDKKLHLEFSNYADRLEWTFYDMHKGATHHGVTVNHLENMRYTIALKNTNMNSYLSCNSIDKLNHSTSSLNSTTLNLKTSCKDCEDSIIPIVNSQISELLKSKVVDQIEDGLYWHLSQIITSQHFTGPISLAVNLD